jgi:hypothetical protein
MSRQLLSVNKYQLPSIKGRQGVYYIVDGEKYDRNFPEEWALNHWSSNQYNLTSGPKSCGNCRAYGSINDVFVFYCARFIKIYNGTRGGYIYCSEDTNEAELWKEFPYMEGVTFDEIGDAEVQTKRSVVSDFEDYEEERTASMRKLLCRHKNKK